VRVLQRDKFVLPVVKWVGGKRQLLPEIIKHIPENFSVYYEPFLGGAAVLFWLQPPRAIVNDINVELINMYQVIKNDVELLIEDLKKHRNDREYYYYLRELDRDKDKFRELTPVERASRFIYLNKTCYNGLCRVNRNGEFNAPFGKYKNPNIVNERILRSVSKYLNRAQIEFFNTDFAEVLDDVKSDSFIYFDPPYYPLSESANFTGYVQGGFGPEEQIRLKQVCDQLSSRGIRFLLSNSATDFILNLYRDYYIEIVRAKRVINSRGDRRGPVSEVLIRNY